MNDDFADFISALHNVSTCILQFFFYNTEKPYLIKYLKGWFKQKSK